MSKTGLVAPGQLLAARTVCWQPSKPDGSGDIAGLELSDNPPPSASSLCLVKAKEPWGHSFRAFGFPRGHENGVWASGRILGGEATGWLQIEDVKQTGYFIEPGFSGGPVWDDSLHGVVGMTIAVESQKSVRAAFILPTEVIVAAWPDMRSILQQQFRQQWFTREQEIRASIISQELDNHTHPHVVESPLAAPWIDFAGRPGWHEHVARELGRMRDATKRFRELAWLLSLIDRVDCSANYQLVVDGLRDVVADRTLDEISKVVAHLEKLEKEEDWRAGSRWMPPEDELLTTARQLRSRVLDLRDISRYPQFARCFQVMGSLGSGKTHFCTSLMAHHQACDLGEVETEVGNWGKSYLVLRLNRLYANSPLSELILIGIREMTAINWITLDEFNEYLELLDASQGGEDGLQDRTVTPTRLVILVDDLQAWTTIRSSFEQELISYIQDNSRLHSVYWLITLQDTEYERVVEHSHGFWETYSFLGQENYMLLSRKDRPLDRKLEQLPHVGGWLMLDELNRKAGTGRGILRRNLPGTMDGASLASELLDSDDPTARYLVHPFIAWTLLELRDTVSVETLVNLHFIEFIVRFWKRRVSRIDHAPLSRAEVDQSIYLISSALVELADLTPQLQALVEQMTELAKTKASFLHQHSLANSAIAVLERACLLRRVNVPDPKSPGWIDERVQVRFEPFWELHIAQKLWEKLASEIRTQADLRAMVEAFLEPVTLSQMKEGVFEFFLLLADQRNRPMVEGLAMADIWYLGFRSDSLSAAATWFAGAKAPGKIQHLLASWATTHRGSALPRRTLFSFMHFLSEIENDVLDLPTRLSLLQPHFYEIYEAGLALYYLYIVGNLLDVECDNEVILASMVHLANCEIMGITLSLASLTVSSILKNAEDNMDESLDIIIRYLRLEHCRLKQEEEIREAASTRTAEWNRYFFREWVLFAFFQAMIPKRGLNTYEMLVDRNWYRPDALKLGRPVSLEMEREANIALGFWYRTTTEKGRASFVRLVATLVDNSEERERELAYWLIYHTEPRHGQRDAAVDSIFHPFLEEISSDPHMTRFVHRQSQVFSANQGHSESVCGLDVTVCGQYAISASADRTLKLWSVKNRQVIRTLTGHLETVCALSITRDGSFVVSASRDETLKVWDIPSGFLVHTLEGHRDSVNSVATAPGGSFAVSCSDDATIRVWDVVGGELLHTLEGHESWATKVAFAAGGMYIISGSEDETIRIWDTSTWQLAHVLTEHKGSIVALAPLPDGFTFVSASADGMAKIWRIGDEQSLRTLWGYSQDATDMKMTGDGQVVVFVHRNGDLKAWNLRNGDLVAKRRTEISLRACAVGRDGRFVVTGCDSGQVRFFGLGVNAFYPWS